MDATLPLRDPLLFAVILAALLMFGLWFNSYVERRVESSEPGEQPFTWVWVVFGTLATLAGLAVIDWQAAALALICFTASGVPMIIGAIGRHERRQQKLRRLMHLAASEELARMERDRAEG